MEKALKREIEDTYKDTIVKRLVETHHFDLPETLVERELEAIIRQHMQQPRSGQERTPTSALETEDLTSFARRHRDEAARRVKVGLVSRGDRRERRADGHAGRFQRRNSCG